MKCFIQNIRKEINDNSEKSRLEIESKLKVILFKPESFKSSALFFESNIPQGYGLGSSGALVAAFYNRYVKKKIS